MAKNEKTNPELTSGGCPMGFGEKNMINEGGAVFPGETTGDVRTPTIAAPLATPGGYEDADRADEGYFGPNSITWRVMSDPSSKLGGAASMLMQALNAPMMKLFYYASHSRDEDGQLFDDKRADNTAAYFQTITFGDKAHVDKAAETVRRMHSHAKWTNPHTGELLEADRPEWLAWTHNTFIYCLVHAMNVYGPGLEYYEIEQFIQEQKVGAKLIGLDETNEELVPGTWSTLQMYIDGQKGWMSVGTEAAETAIGLMSPEPTLNPLKKVEQALGLSMFALLPEWACQMYGIRKDKKLEKAIKMTKSIIKIDSKTDKAPARLKEALAKAQEHPYRKVAKKK